MKSRRLILDLRSNRQPIAVRAAMKPTRSGVIHNHVILDDRTDYEDWSEPGRKRHLLRLWQCPPNGRPLPPVFALAGRERRFPRSRYNSRAAMTSGVKVAQHSKGLKFRSSVSENSSERMVIRQQPFILARRVYHAHKRSKHARSSTDKLPNAIERTGGVNGALRTHPNTAATATNPDWRSVAGISIIDADKAFNTHRSRIVPPGGSLS
jgi:hypothetical protein